MKRMIFFCGLALLLALFAVPTPEAKAQAPLLINYQGRLMDGTNLMNGPVNLRFRIFNAESGGFLVYESTNIATAVDGLYTSTIGQFTTIGNLLPGLGLDGGDGGPRWLQVAVNGVDLTPRERIAAVPFSVATYGLWPNQRNSFSLGTYGQGLVIPAGENAVILGGQQNLVASTNAAIVAGRENYIDTDAEESIVLGGRGNRVEYFAAQNAILGGYSNKVDSFARRSVITGGEHNLIGPSRLFASIGGGSYNLVNGDYGVVAGGQSNRVASSYGVIAGGWDNQAGFAGVVGGGSANVATGVYATVAGGFNNRARGSDSVVAGGLNNVAVGTASMVPGGNGNQANGDFSFAAGRNAFAQHEGSFVWNGSFSTFSSTATNQFLVRAPRGVGINTNNPQAALHV
ncbi:MAG TPA: hypothetical protein PKA21_11785, partial [Kiritimatiellia bacterium]|nr:hypothetical protein [Kiritimatiellia bacterium]